MATPGPKPKPKHLRAIDGGAGKKGDKDETAATGIQCEIPDCPDHLKDEAREEWTRITAELENIGRIYLASRAPIAAYCVAYGRWVEAEIELEKTGWIIKTPNGYPAHSPYLAIANKAMEQMRAFATEFGMTPSSLTRAATSGQMDLFDDFAKYMRGAPGHGQKAS